MAFIYKLNYATKTKVIDPKTIGKIVVTREEGEIFFREKMSGTLELSGADYDFLIESEYFAVECCQEITLQIERKCGSGDSELFWQGYFNLYDIEWDLDNKTASIKRVNVRDQYSPVFANYQKEVNWLDGTQPVRPNTPAAANYQPLTPFRYQFPTYPDYNPTGSNLHGRARHFNTAIQWLIKQTMAGSGYESYGTSTPLEFSQFLNSAVNPVTGKTNYLSQVSILHLSDAKRPAASNPAVKGIVTLKSVLDDLKKLYNAYWYIDEDDVFRIEHISFFPQLAYTPPVLTLDLTTPNFKDVMSGNKKFSYQGDRLKGIEGFEMSISQAAQDTVSDLHTTPFDIGVNEFDGAYMIYSETCVPKNEKGEKSSEYSPISQFITNWGAIALRPDTLPDEGWALVHTIFDNSNMNVPLGWLPISGQRWNNGCLAITRLFYDFGRYDSSFLYGTLSTQKEKPKQVNQSGTVTEKPIRVRTAKKIKTFPDIELPMCCGDEYDWTGFIKHPLADQCVVQQLEYDLIVQTVTATIVAPNTCTDIPYPDFDEIDEPSAGCPNAGSLIRIEEKTTSIPDNSSYYTYITTYTSYYADGSCGEYSSTREEKKRIPKRGNGPR